jgi:hypothetical protein
LTRQSIFFQRVFRRTMDPRVKPAYDVKNPDRSAADAVLDHPGS